MTIQGKVIPLWCGGSEVRNLLAASPKCCAVACRRSVALGSSSTWLVGVYARKGWQVIALAGWGIGVRDRTHSDGPVIAQVRLRRVVAGIVRRAIAII